MGQKLQGTSRNQDFGASDLLEKRGHQGFYSKVQY
jgi:hypothetical protein